MQGGPAIFWCRRYRVSNSIQSVSLSSLDLLHRLASKNLSLFCTHIELPQPHSRLSFNTFIRPLLPEVLYQSIDANTLPQDSNQLPRYLLNNSQAVLSEASHTRPTPSPPKNSRSPQYGKRCQLFSSSTKLCLYPIQSLSRESWTSGDTGLLEIEYTFAQNSEHAARGGLSGLSSQVHRFIFYSIC